MARVAPRTASVWQSVHQTGHPVSGPSEYQYPTDWYPIRSGPDTEIDFGVIRPDAPDDLTVTLKDSRKTWQTLPKMAANKQVK